MSLTRIKPPIVPGRKTTECAACKQTGNPTKMEYVEGILLELCEDFRSCNRRTEQDSND